MVQRWLPTGLNPIIRAETDLINQLVDYLSSDELSNSSSENAKHYHPVPGSFKMLKDCCFSLAYMVGVGRTKQAL